MDLGISGQTALVLGGTQGLGLACAQDFTGQTRLVVHRRRAVTALDPSALVDPCQRLQLRVLNDQRFSSPHELLGVHLLVGDVTRDPHQLFLALEQAQTHPLLRVFDIAFDRFEFALLFFDAQIGEG